MNLVLQFEGSQTEFIANAVMAINNYCGEQNGCDFISIYEILDLPE